MWTGTLPRHLLGLTVHGSQAVERSSLSIPLLPWLLFVLLSSVGTASSSLRSYYIILWYPGIATVEFQPPKGPTGFANRNYLAYHRNGASRAFRC